MEDRVGFWLIVIIALGIMLTGILIGLLVGGMLSTPSYDDSLSFPVSNYSGQSTPYNYTYEDTVALANAYAMMGAGHSETETYAEYIDRMSHMANFWENRRQSMLLEKQNELLEKKCGCQ